MSFEPSPRVKELQAQLLTFFDEHIYPNEPQWATDVNTGDRWKTLSLIEGLKLKTRARNLWNLFLPESEHGPGLTNLEYAPLCEIMGRVLFPTPCVWLPVDGLRFH